MTKLSCTLVFTAALLLGCNSEPAKGPAPAPAAPTVQTETGRFALQKMLVPARFWAADALPIRLDSTPTKESNGRDGKAALWRATFASAARQKAEAFIWSGVSTPDTPKGISHGTEDMFNSANRSTQPFDLNYLKVDSDEAFNVAQQHGGKELLGKNPKLDITYQVDFDPRLNQLKWHVIYGESPSTLTVLVDASTGRFLHKE